MIYLFIMVILLAIALFAPFIIDKNIHSKV